MNVLFHFLFFLFIAIPVLKTNAQPTYKPDGSFKSNADYQYEQNQQRLNNSINKALEQNNTYSEPAERPEPGSNITTRYERYQNEYYPNLEGDGLIPFKDAYSDKYGFANKYNGVVINATFFEPSAFKNGYARVATLNESGVKKYSYIDTKGNAVIPSSGVNIYATDFNIETEGFMYGVKGRKGETKVPFIYLKISPLNNAIACVNKDYLWGGINENGNLIIPAIYYKEFYFIDGIAKVEKTVGRFIRTGFIDNRGKEIIPCNYYCHDTYQSDFIVLADSTKNCGVMDNTGAIKIPFIYSRITPLKNGYACVEKDYKWGAVDHTGKLVVPAIYDQAFEFVDGYAIAYLNFKKVTIDTQGNSKKPKGGDFHDGVARIEDNTRFGYIDTAGNVVSSCIYILASDFHDGLAAVSLDIYHYGYINTKGEVVIPFIYEYASDFENGEALVAKKAGKYGYIDKAGNYYKKSKKQY